jgi:hypothetical protein
LVSHLKSSAGSIVFTDSTSNANNGAASGTPVAVNAVIDGAMDTPGTTGVGADYASGASIDNISIFTVEAWIRRQTLPAAGLQTVISKGGSANGTFWAMQIRPDNGGATANRLSLRGGWGTTVGVWDSGTQIDNPNALLHVVITYNKGSTANNPSMYINGAPETVARTTGPAGTSPNDSAGNFTAGYFSGDFAGAFDGYIDEIRYSDVARSADWIKTSYNNMVSTSTFYAYGGNEKEVKTNSSSKARGGGNSSANVPVKVRGGVKFR